MDAAADLPPIAEEFGLEGDYDIEARRPASMLER
jgi:hypothetical protein